MFRKLHNTHPAALRIFTLQACTIPALLTGRDVLGAAHFIP
jgi:superfamily II DNA/RNA helicase